jgi:hypothetical protein
MISHIETFTFYSIIRCLLLPRRFEIISIPFIKHNIKQKSIKKPMKTIRKQITFGKKNPSGDVIKTNEYCVAERFTFLRFRIIDFLIKFKMTE